MNTIHPLIAELAAERKARGLSVLSLARRAGIHHTTVLHWESGRSQPRVAELGRYAFVLGYTVTLTPVGEVTR